MTTASTILAALAVAVLLYSLTMPRVYRDEELDLFAVRLAGLALLTAAVIAR